MKFQDVYFYHVMSEMLVATVCHRVMMHMLKYSIFETSGYSHGGCSLICCHT